MIIFSSRRQSVVPNHLEWLGVMYFVYPPHSYLHTYTLIPEKLDLCLLSDNLILFWKKIK